MIKKYSMIVFAGIFIAGGIMGTERNITELDAIASNRFPRNIAFRATEYALRNGMFYVDTNGVVQRNEDGRILKKSITLEQFSKDMERYPIIIGKALEEERFKGMDRVADGYRLLKQTHPQKTVLLHFNGRNRRPEFYVGDTPFFAGHWLYRVPSAVSTDIPASNQETIIQVDDLTPYLNAKQRLIPNMEFCLYALKEGLPDFSHTEYVSAVSADVTANTLTLRRGENGSKPRSFTAGQTMLAQAMLVADRWQYNFSPTCPKDDNGRTCSEALVEDVVTLFSTNGYLNYFDGILFDAASVDSAITAFNGQVDLNMDGKVDHAGYVNGLYQPLIGYTEFSRLLRERMGDDFLILGDSRTPGHHRSFAYYNGVESEGWPAKKDVPYAKQWSSGVARHQFLNTHLQAPALHHFHAQAEEPNLKRLYQVAAACLDAGFTAKYQILKGTDEVVGYTDEMSKGTDFDFSGWLGKPIGEMIRLAERAPALNIAENRSFQPSELKTTDDIAGLPVSVLKIDHIASPGDEVYLRLTMKADPLQDYQQVIPRVCRITAIPSGKPIAPYDAKLQRELNKSPSAYHQEVYVDPDGESYGIYFRWLNTAHVDLTFEIEGHEPAILESLAIHHAPDVIYREFENGVVIGNPSLSQQTLDLQALFPDESFRRIHGHFDSDYNDGASVGAELEIAPLDGIFLVRAK